MAYQDLREFVRALEKNDELKRIPFEVDPRLEITEFADRAVKQGGPALLFERPTGYQVPVLVNAFASTRKMEIALEVNSVEEVARLMAGSDWPVCLVASGYAQWFEVLRDYFAGFSETVRARVFGGTAVEVYGL